jgi:hypothetical protein
MKVSGNKVLKNKGRKMKIILSHFVNSLVQKSNFYWR